MCGIVGYIGTKKVSPILLKGLKNLEYRGYDSAGMAVLCKGLKCKKSAGTKIAKLRFNERPMKMTIKGERISSGRRKLGAIIGYNVKNGINVSIYPGVKIGSNCWIEAETLVRRDVNHSR